VKKCVDTVVDRAPDRDGPVSGEHGIGLGKKHCLEKEFGPVTIDVMRALKRSWAAVVAESLEDLGFMGCFV
jgi:D-lactate dehydrogenase (cytochrome)